MRSLERIDRTQRSWAAKGARILLIHSVEIRAFPLEKSKGFFVREVTGAPTI